MNTEAAQKMKEEKVMRSGSEMEQVVEQTTEPKKEEVATEAIEQWLHLSAEFHAAEPKQEEATQELAEQNEA